MKTIIATGLILFFSFISCKRKTEAERFADFMNDTSNHILQKQIVNGVDITVKYIPVQYQKIKAGKNADSPADYDHNFLIDVKINKAEVKKDKATSLYLDFDIQNDFELKIDNQLLVPAICQKVENGMQGNYEYMVAFASDALEYSSAEKAELVYNDKIFGIGQRKFIFSKKDILNIPLLTKN